MSMLGKNILTSESQVAIPPLDKSRGFPRFTVTADKRSGIGSDPNREDDPEYIVRLVGRVIAVSVETVRIVAALPALGLGE